MVAIDVKDLPPKYQAQALQKYMAQQKRRGPPSYPAADGPQKASKYHNSPTERITPSGAVLHFDSQKEARRYDHLAALERAGQIRDLRLQVDFTLQEAYTDTEGRRVRAIRYRRILPTASRRFGSYRRTPRRNCGKSTGQWGRWWWRT